MALLSKVIARLGGLVFALSLSLTSAVPAAAVPAGQTTSNEYISVTSFENPEMERMQPGIPVHWQLSVLPRVPGTGTLTIGFALDNSPVQSDGLHVTIRACSEEWIQDSCNGIESLWLPEQPVSTAFSILNLDGVAHAVGTIPITADPQPAWLMVSIEVQPDWTEPAQADFLVAVSGTGEPLVLRPNGGLARTGFPLNASLWVALATFCASAGVFLLFAKKRRSGGDGSSSALGSSGDVRATQAHTKGMHT